jgi:hypothetical protein
MDSDKARAAGETSAQARLRVERMDIEDCGLDELILDEKLMLVGVEAVLNEFGSTPGDLPGDKFQRIEVPGIALWMLGRVVAKAQEEILRKLGSARERYRAAGVREFIKAPNKPGRNEATRPAVR